MYSLSRFLALVVASGMLFSCDDREPVIITGQSFFPMMDGARFNYKTKYTFGSEGLGEFYDTIQFKVEGDTIIDRKRYKRVVDQLNQVQYAIRIEGSKYFRRDAGQYGSDLPSEYVFLDVSVPVGGRWWRNMDDYIKAEYRILGKGLTRSVIDKMYDNVIDVEVTYYMRQANGSFEYYLTTRHWYAEGIGEIYSFKPYPISMMYADVTLCFISND